MGCREGIIECQVILSQKWIQIFSLGKQEMAGQFLLVISYCQDMHVTLTILGKGVLLHIIEDTTISAEQMIIIINLGYFIVKESKRKH